MIALCSPVMFLRTFRVSVAACSLMWLGGCTDSDTSSPTPVSDGPAATVPHEEHEHAHPSEGPHHGDLIELGNEEFHAEVVHGDGGVVSVYILDGTAKTAVPIDAAELTINISHDGTAEQFKLPADRDAADPEGKSSRFSLKDEELAKDLDNHDAAAKLVVMIDGKSFNGRIEHNHEGAHKDDDGHKH